jgi:class 3 adenylate cyclase/tetratricopeptide (TPR) repeat protein
VTVECQACGAANPTDARFCSRCGAALDARCPHCGSLVGAAARFCPSCGAALGDDSVAEERKLATAVFVDLVDSTALGERVDPERVRSILQAYFSLVSSITQAWGGSVEKFIGDAAVAVFGVPRLREDDPARAVSAALEIAERFVPLAADVERRLGVTLAIRVGVNTGEVIAPTEVRADRPIVTGDAINVAARLQTAAAPGEVVVGERTVEATAQLFRFGEPVDLDVKGKSRSVRARRVVERISGAVEAGPARNLQARVVGRERELSVLGGLLDEAMETRTPRLAIVYGPAGIGKSRLVHEAVEIAASERPDLTVLRGRCPAIGEGVTFWPLAEVVRQAAAISLDDPRSVAEEKLRRRTADVGRGAALRADDIEAITFALATTAGIEIAGNPLDRSRPGSVVAELARRWPQFLSAMTSRNATIVVIEDLHWASDQVVEMLEHLLIRSTGALLLVATARPEFAEAHPTFVAGRGDAATLSLRALGRAHGIALLSGLLRDQTLPPALRDQILDTAEGNPLFLEEIVTRLIEARTLEARDGGWSVADGAAALELPDTINALLAARIDALPDDERRAVREASVVGRVFWEAPVAAAVGESHVSERLERLERRGLVSMRPTSTLTGQLEYLFKHALVRDVAYSGLPLARRARAHAAVAAWLSELAKDRPEELAELVATHYRAALGDGADIAWDAGSPELAEVRRRARTAFLVAGAAARKTFALESAVAFHRAALELSMTDDDRAESLEQLGDDFDAAYDGDRSVPAWEEAIALRQASGERAPLGRLTMKVARMGAIRWGGFTTPMEPGVADRHVDTGLASDPDPETRAWLDVMRAAVGLRWIAFHRPDPVPLAERVRAGEEALAYGDAHGDVAIQANAVRMISSLRIAHGDIEPALELARQRLALISDVADPRERHLLTIETAQTLAWIGGDAASIVPLLLDALRAGRELRVHDHCHSTGVLINALYLAGRWDEIPGYIEEHLGAFNADAAGTTCPFALGVFQLGAAVLADRGDVERARELASSMPANEAPIGMTEALQAVAANAVGDPGVARTIAESVLATGARNYAEEPPIEILAMLDALAALEDWEALRAFLPEARRRAAELALAPAAIARAGGLLAAHDGDIGQAREYLQQAIDGFDRTSVFEAARAREALAAIDPGRRAALLREAADRYGRLGAAPHAARVVSLLGGPEAREAQRAPA